MVTSTSLDLAETRAEFMAECLAGRGFPVEVVGPGMTAYIPPPGQVEAYEAAEGACIDLMEQELGRPQPADRESLTQFYAQLLDTADCLIIEGYDPPPAPSLEVFLEQSDRWHPYLTVYARDEAEWNHINEVCPQP